LSELRLDAQRLRSLVQHVRGVNGWGCGWRRACACAWPGGSTATHARSRRRCLCPTWPAGRRWLSRAPASCCGRHGQASACDGFRGCAAACVAWRRDGRPSASCSLGSWRRGLLIWRRRGFSCLPLGARGHGSPAGTAAGSASHGVAWRASHGATWRTSHGSAWRASHGATRRASHGSAWYAAHGAAYGAAAYGAAWSCASHGTCASSLCGRAGRHARSPSTGGGGRRWLYARAPAHGRASAHGSWRPGSAACRASSCCARRCAQPCSSAAALYAAASCLAWFALRSWRALRASSGRSSPSSGFGARARGLPRHLPE